MNGFQGLECMTLAVSRMEDELSVLVPSWSAGMWSLNNRIASLLEDERSVRNHINAVLEASSDSIRKAAFDIQVLENETSSLRLCLSNAARALHQHGSFIKLVTKFLLLCRRRDRMKIVLETAKKLAEMASVLSGVRPRTVAKSLGHFRNLVECLPHNLSMIPVLQEEFATKLGVYRRDILTLVVGDCCLVDSRDVNLITQRLSDTYGVGADSILSNELTFWFLSSPKEESQLVAHSIDCFLRHGAFRSSFASESWSMIDSGDSRYEPNSHEKLRAIVSRLATVVCQHVPVLGADFVASVELRLHEMNVILVFMALSGSDLSMLISPSEQKDCLEDSHETFLRRKRLANMNSLLNSDFWITRLELINRMVPRHRSLGVYQLCTAVESVSSGIIPELISELRWSVYEATTSSSLAHALQRWRQDVFEDPAQANSYLAFEIKSFNSFLHCINIPTNALNAMSMLIHEVVTREILVIVPSLYDELRGGDDTHILTEIVSDLQQQVSSAVIPESARWGLIYESIQALSMESGDFMLLWAQEQLSRIPVAVLADFISTAEHTRLDVRLKLVDELQATCRTLLDSDSQ